MKDKVNEGPCLVHRFFISYLFGGEGLERVLIDRQHTDPMGV